MTVTHLSSLLHLSGMHRCRVVHVIELKSADDSRQDDATEPVVLVNLTSRSRASPVNHVVLVLKAQNPVHWDINLQRLHCSIDVVVSNCIFYHSLLF